MEEVGKVGGVQAVEGLVGDEYDFEVDSVFNWNISTSLDQNWG